jgi:hypothetical protein
MLHALRQGDATVLEDDENFAHFAWFMATQYMRTPKRAQSAVEAVGPLAPNFNIEAAWGLLRTIFSSNMGAALYVRRNNMRLTYLRAAQPSFIAGDQPIVNARAADLPDGTPPTELEFYYPLTPHLAMSVAFDGRTRSVEHRSLATADIAPYNSLIASASSEQIYASTEATLRALPA